MNLTSLHPMTGHRSVVWVVEPFGRNVRQIQFTKFRGRGSHLHCSERLVRHATYLQRFERNGRDRPNENECRA